MPDSRASPLDSQAAQAFGLHFPVHARTGLHPPVRVWGQRGASGAGQLARHRRWVWGDEIRPWPVVIQASRAHQRHSMDARLGPDLPGSRDDGSSASGERQAALGIDARFPWNAPHEAPRPSRRLTETIDPNSIPRPPQGGGLGLACRNGAFEFPIHGNSFVLYSELCEKSNNYCRFKAGFSFPS